MRSKMKIGEIREIIRRGQSTRNWLFGGGIIDEIKRDTSIPGKLQERIDAIKALDIPARFADDIERAAQEVVYLERCIARWHSYQEQPAEDRRTCAEGGPRHVFLGNRCCTLCGRPKLQLVISN